MFEGVRSRVRPIKIWKRENHYHLLSVQRQQQRKGFLNINDAKYRRHFSKLKQDSRWDRSSGIMIFDTASATSDDGKNPEEKKVE